MNGVLPVDKPEGPTSHDVVQRARRVLGIRRIGHTGTLDPFASGLLLLCLGPATRLAEYLTALPKTYLATLRLGEATDTDDLTGQVIRRSEEWRTLTEAELRAAFDRQRGSIEQLPPLYSAKKVEGERMYAAARRGEQPPRRPVQVTIYRIELLDVRLPEVEFEVECSSGTYIRAIARDVGEAVGVGAHLRALRRTQVGAHTLERAVSLDRLDEHDSVEGALLTPLQALAHLPQVLVAGSEAAAVRHGGSIPAPATLAPDQPVALCTARGELLAIGEPRGDHIRPRKVFA